MIRAHSALMPLGHPTFLTHRYSNPESIGSKIQKVGSIIHHLQNFIAAFFLHQKSLHLK